MAGRVLWYVTKQQVEEIEYIRVIKPSIRRRISLGDNKQLEGDGSLCILLPWRRSSTSYKRWVNYGRNLIGGLTDETTLPSEWMVSQTRLLLRHLIILDERTHEIVEDMTMLGLSTQGKESEWLSNEKFSDTRYGTYRFITRVMKG